MTLRYPVSAVRAMLVTACLCLTPLSAAQAQTVSTNNYGVDPTIARLQSRADANEQALRKVTGRLEEMGFQNNQLRKELAGKDKMIAALEKRLVTMEQRLKSLEELANRPLDMAAAAANAPAETTIALVGETEAATPEAISALRDETDEELESKSPALNLDASPDELFKQGKTLLLRGEYPTAEAAFSHFVETHSDDPRVSDAQYWLAESFLVQEAYPEASTAYVTLVSSWPTATRAPDALVKLARVQRLLEKPERACQALAEFDKLYPDAGATTRASAAREKSRAGC